jgi:YD repeat-containing protein
VTGRIATNYYPNGQTTTLSYYNVTNDLRLQTLWHRNGSNATVSKFDYSYDADGQIATWTQQADAQTPQVWVTEHDPVDQLLGVTVRSNSVVGAILKRYAYGYDKAGNRTSEMISGGTGSTPSVASASHNNLNQLTSLTGGGPVRFAGTLDELGTVTVAGSNAPVDSRTTNFVGYASVVQGTNVVTVKATDYSSNTRTNNYELVVTNLIGSQTLQYDLNGNLTNDGSGITYEYDAVNRTVAINRGTTNRTEFVYDGLGRRVHIIEKTNGVAMSTNKYLWCGIELPAQTARTAGSRLDRVQPKPPVLRRLRGKSECSTIQKLSPHRGGDRDNLFPSL